MVATIYVTVGDGHQTSQPAVGIGAVFDPARDTGLGADTASVKAELSTITDYAAGADAILKAVLKMLFDSGIAYEAVDLGATILTNDASNGFDDVTLLAALIQLVDNGLGLDSILGVVRLQVYIRTDGIVEPFGLVIVRPNSRVDAVPSLREHTEEVPGRHGEVDFGQDFGPRGVELRLISQDGLSKSEMAVLTRYIAERLSPLRGVLRMAWESEPDRYLQVRLAGAIQPEELRQHLEVTIPLKATEPFYLGSTVRSFSGSGTVVSEGNIETPATVTVRGPVTDPSVSVAGAPFSWDGTVGSADELVIDGERMTVTFNGVNALSGFSGSFPVLQPGDNTIEAAGGTTTVTWRDRWI